MRSDGRTPSSTARSTSSSIATPASASSAASNTTRRSAGVSERKNGGGVADRSPERLPSTHRRSHAPRNDVVASRTSMSALRSNARSSELVENVLSGIAIAPIRAAANHATTNCDPFGYSRPTCEPGPAPHASRAFASVARTRGGLGVGEHVVVAHQERVTGAPGCAFAEERGDGERQAVTRVDDGGAHDGGRRGDTLGRRLRSPATASIVA